MSIFDMGKNTSKQMQKPIHMLPQLGERSGIPAGIEDIGKLHGHLLMKAAESDVFTSQMLNTPFDNPVIHRRQEEQLLESLRLGLVSKEKAFQVLGIDYALVEKRFAQEQARQWAAKRRQQQRIKEGNAAFKALQPFFEQWFARGRTGWFKRGDVARILKVTPQEAGFMLQLALEANSLVVLRTENGWWHITDFAVKMVSTPKKQANPLSAVGLKQAMDKLPACSMDTQQQRQVEAKIIRHQHQHLQRAQQEQRGYSTTSLTLDGASLLP